MANDTLSSSDVIGVLIHYRKYTPQGLQKDAKCRFIVVVAMNKGGSNP
jgi:hypothetical protein